jgi:muramoyltetrapeptide carboxypeptidase
VGDRRGLETLTAGCAEGPLAGGCLSILCAALGTSEAPSFTGRIVLLEDTDEPLYRVDRMLTQMARSGCLDDAAGFAIGTVTNLEGESQGERTNLAALWRDILGPLHKPAITGVRFGHVDNPITLPLGRRARLDADRLVLAVQEPAVT